MIGRLFWLICLLCFLYAVAVHQPAALSVGILAFIWRDKLSKNPRRSIRRDV